MRKHIDAIKSLMENETKRDTKVADKIDVDIDLDSGLSKGEVSTTRQATGVEPARPGYTSRGPARMRVPMDAESAHHLANAMASGLEDDVVTPVGHDVEEVVPLPRTPENLPAVITQAIAQRNTGDVPITFNPRWTMVRDLPGYMAQPIRAMGRQIFSAFTDTPIEDINVMASPMLNSATELNMMAHWVRTFGVRDDEAEVTAENIMPGYSANVQVWNTEGYTFLYVMDHAGGYIYSWPEGRGVHLPAREEQALIREALVGLLEKDLQEALGAFDLGVRAGMEYLKTKSKPEIPYQRHNNRQWEQWQDGFRIGSIETGKWRGKPLSEDNLPEGAFDDGFDAHKAGNPKGKNPHDRGSDEAGDWNDGYDISQALDDEIMCEGEGEIGTWRPWGGGENPRPGEKVHIRRRDGEERRNVSDLYDWAHDGSGSDILEYMPLEV